MSFDREQIYQALFSTIQGLVTAAPLSAVTVSRSAQHYSKVPAAKMPAVFILEKGESYKQTRGLPKKTVLKSNVLIYTTGSNSPAVAASTQINNILTALDSTFGPEIMPDNTQHLGLPGIVEHAWVEGQTDIYEAILVDTSIAIVPIHILVAG